MHSYRRVAIAAAIATTGFSGLGAIALSATPAAAAAAPNCATVSASLVKAALGGSPNSLTATSGSTGTDTFDGYKATTVTCTYSSSVSITYSSPATVANYDSTVKTLKNATMETTVSGIGNGAFSGTGSNTISSCPANGGKCTSTSVTVDNLWVLVTGKTIFEISATASKTTPSGEQALAKKMVPLV